MPQLAASGLSESWLLKTCGHQHWKVLASMFGLAAPDFHAADGSKLYAAFTAVRLRDADLAQAREHGRFTIETRVERVSRTQFRSRHALSADGAECGALEMLSVFVRRAVEGVNRSVERAIPSGRPVPFDPTADADALAKLAHDFRKACWSQAHGLHRERGRELATHVFQPCPHTDFNGADFLYFASFQAFLDRAEWDWFGGPTAAAQSRQRDIFFYGNVEIGEAVRLTLRAAETGPGRLVHWVEFTELMNGRRLADAISVREGLKPAQAAAADSPRPFSR
jgi:probable biosynthetic protein (TIGR04099 family)